MHSPRRPSPSIVVACVAVVLSLGSTATAASLITSAQIRNNTITSGDIRNNTIRGADVRNGSVALADISTGARRALRGNTGAQGVQGVPGNAAGSTKAFATVASDGTKSRDVGVAGVTPGVGFTSLYCVDTAVPVQNVVATVLTGTAGVTAVFDYGTTAGCPAATDFFVRVVDAAGGLVPAPFTFLAS